MPENVQEQLITINDKTYKVSDLSESAKGLVNNINVVNQMINQKQIEIDVMKISSETLVGKLIAETASLEEVKKEVAAN